MHGLNPQTFETPPFREDLEAQSVVLDPPAAPYVPLTQLLRGRSSCRRFAPEPIEIAELGGLLHWSYGVLGTTEIGHEFSEHPVPSGGGLYPLKLSVLAQHVEGISAGVYHYVPLGHRLELVLATRSPA